MKYAMTKDRRQLLTIMAYLYHHPGSEGVGGKRATLVGDGYSNLGDWKVGTRLRAPWGPLYEMREAERQGKLDFLVTKGCIEVYKTVEDTAFYRVTEKGTQFLQVIPYRLIDYISWYKHPSGWSSEQLKYCYSDPSVFTANVKAQLPGSNAGIIPVRIYEYEGGEVSGKGDLDYKKVG